MDVLDALTKPSIDYDLCIFCQLHSRKNLTEASSRKISTVGKTVTIRSECGSANSMEANVIDRLDLALSESKSNSQKLLWHKLCYAQFTDKNKLVRLQKRQSTKSRRSKSLSASFSLRSISINEQDGRHGKKEDERCQGEQDIWHKLNSTKHTTKKNKRDELSEKKQDARPWNTPDTSRQNSISSSQRDTTSRNKRGGGSRNKEDKGFYQKLLDAISSDSSFCPTCLKRMVDN